MHLIGQRFGRLRVTGVAGKRRKSWIWTCECDCGGTTVSETYRLRSGIHQSCGCLRVEVTRKRNTTHGLRHTPEYYVWCNMRKRCSDPKDRYFHVYGGLGIKVCDEWRNSFEAFIEDMGYRPSPRHTLDRRNTLLGYSPENCRWATQKEQQNNRRNNRHVTVGDKTMTIAQWSDETGLKQRTIGERLRRGWSNEDSILAIGGRNL